MKYSGAGNTFYLIDHRQPFFSLATIPSLCEQHGVDGCILMERSDRADAKMRIFNRDGSEAEMCGNGLRCFIHFLRQKGISREIYHVETQAGLQKGWFVDHEVCLELAPPRDLKLNLSLQLHFINTGVPHAISFVEDVDCVNVEEQGRALRFSKLFAPAGANVNFVTLRDRSTLLIRTYERGVEKETQACGTGSVASALIANKIFRLTSPINIIVRSGEKIKVFFTPDWSQVAMVGPVTYLGDFNLETCEKPEMLCSNIKETCL